MITEQQLFIVGRDKKQYITDLRETVDMKYRKREYAKRESGEEWRGVESGGGTALSMEGTVVQSHLPPFPTKRRRSHIKLPSIWCFCQGSAKLHPGGKCNLQWALILEKDYSENGEVRICWTSWGDRGASLVALVYYHATLSYMFVYKINYLVFCYNVSP